MVLGRIIRKEHISPGLIAILSPRRMEDSVISVYRGGITQYNVFSNGNLSFSTIQSFRGLENSIILLVDIESYDNARLFYIGLSRARAALYVFESENAHSERIKLLLKAVDK
jgi:hypothetical protein